MLAAINGLSVDNTGRLTWEGGLVRVQRRVTLSWWQTIAAAIIAFGPLSQGILAAEAKMACFSFIEGWYNPVRLQSALSYRSPIAYEAAAEVAIAEPS